MKNAAMPTPSQPGTLPHAAPNTARVPTAHGARAQALARLAASRGALQQQLTGPPDARDLPLSGLPRAGRWRGRLAALWRHARRQARGQPVLATALTAAERWWHRHPWRTPCELALIELRLQLTPLVQRHPWASVTLAAGVGAAVMAGQPWRLRWVSRQLAPLPHRLATWLKHTLMNELQHLPLQALFTHALRAAANQTTNTSIDSSLLDDTLPHAQPSQNGRLHARSAVDLPAPASP